MELFTVSTKALLETTNCSSFYSCLSNRQRDEFRPCKVIGTNDTGFLFLESDQYKECPYWFSFPNKTVCICPVHMELFSKYNV